MKYKQAQNLFLNQANAYCSEPTMKYYELNLSFFDKYLQESYKNIKLDDLELIKLTKEDFIGYINKCREKGIKNSSVRTYARAIKVFFRWCHNEGHIKSNITHNVKFPKADNKQVIPLSTKRVEILYDAISTKNCATRNAAIFSLMLDCGLRLGEIVALDISDIDFNNDFIQIINTKNNKCRIVPLPKRTRQKIKAYLDERNSKHRAVFLDHRNYGRITEGTIKTFISKLKVYDRDIHCHLLRHTFATSFMMGGGQLEILRVLLGHEEYTVTKGYIHLASQLGVINYDIYKLDGIMFSKYIAYTPTNLLTS